MIGPYILLFLTHLHLVPTRLGHLFKCTLKVFGATYQIFLNLTNLRSLLHGLYINLDIFFVSPQMYQVEHDDFSLKQ